MESILVQKPPMKNSGPMPCPFCGSKRVTLLIEWSDDAGRNRHVVECRDCKASGPEWISTGWTHAGQKAIELWNQGKVTG